MCVCVFRVKLEGVEAERQLCVKTVEKEQIRAQELLEELQQRRLDNQQEQHTHEVHLFLRQLPR